jgi:cytochrome P450
MDLRPHADAINALLESCQKQVVRRGLALVDLDAWIPTPPELRFRKELRTLRALVSSLLEERGRKGGIQGDVDLYSLYEGQDVSRDFLVDQFLTLLLAGHETTAMALTWTYDVLGRNPEADRRVATGDAAYTRLCLEEVLRLYPTVPFLGRQALEDDVVQGFHVPKGSILVVCPFATHRRAELWPEPAQFRPERFLPQAKEARHPLAYIPFGAGPRGCVGQHFAWLELQSAVAELSPKLRLEPVESTPPYPMPLVSLRPERRVLVRVRRR